MSVEARRGCGYRKVGGLYLVGGGLSAPCDRMPFPLERCRCCGGGVKFTRGPQWLQPDFFTPHEGCRDTTTCPVCRNREDFGPHLLLWIGRGHYTPEEYLRESREMGVSRRLSAIPKGLVLGETWVLLAHLDAVEPERGIGGEPVCANCGKDRAKHWVGTLEGDAMHCPTDRNGNGGETDYEPAKAKPGIFCAFVPRAVELILRESDATPERRAKEEKRGVTVVTVPDDDRDHQGSVWDDDKDEDSQPELLGVAS